MTSDISKHIEKAGSQLKDEHDSMVQNIKEEISSAKKKALSKV
ncbi:MAG TPA: hypothetical protein VGQ03_00820 [Nitrososphaera sp.]|jgi:hypothetical protein|nr:hypothetical protein [Nitrososphaera sp.]